MTTLTGTAGVFLTLLVGSWTADSASDVTGSRSVASLKFVFAVARHGNRGAHRDYAQDPYPLTDRKYYPYGNGALTPKGRVQMHKLGMRVRALYDGFINATFYPEEIRATSSPTERSMMSGQTFLAGLYPPQGFQVWDKVVLWQPVPLYSTSPDHAHNIMSCQKFLETFFQTKKDYYIKYATNVSEVLDYYIAATGSKNVSSEFFWLLWDKLQSERIEGYDLPEWTRRFFPEPLRHLIMIQYLDYYAANNNVVRLITGNLVEEIMVTMKNKIDGKLANRRINFYSGHDSSIIPLMVALGVPRTAAPLVSPGSALLLELHQDTATSKYFVKVLFIDGGSAELQPQRLPLADCGDPCYLTRLLNNTSWLSGLDFDKECLVPGSPIKAYNWT